MYSTFNSPFATSFKTGVKNGTPCSEVVQNISKRTGKPVNTVVQSLVKAGLCFSQKINGTWVFWPTFNCKTTTTHANNIQTNLWQSFVEWCLATGCVTPYQLDNNTTSQKTFMNFCRNFFGKQFTGVKKTTKTKTTKKNSWNKTWKSARRNTTSGKNRWTTSFNTKRSTKRVRKSTPTTWNRNSYKFPTWKSRSANSSRRYVRAA
jgi:hypothetical protein